MDENKTIKYLAYICVFVFILALCWYMLRPTNGTGHYNNIETGLGNIEAEQRRAGESVERITSGIERSEASAGRIGESIERSTDIARNLADDIRRNDEIMRDALERIEFAERRKREADAGIERCESRITDGLRINDESKSIFARY